MRTNQSLNLYKRIQHYVVLGAGALVFSATLNAATSVTQRGITWTFNADYTVGQYANGDYYVVAPSGLMITGITPASTYTVTTSANVTISQASPAVVTWSAHGFTAGRMVRFTTTGTLPAGLTAGKKYYIISSGLTTSSFRVSATYGGTAVNTTSAGSGTHTCEIGRVMNGAMLNPVASTSDLQGWDSGMYAQYGPSYSEAMNVARPGGEDLSSGNPLIINPTASLVSSTSAIVDSNISKVRPQLTDTAILTVVSTAPTAGSFRPQVFGATKTTTWNKSQLDYTILRSLTPVTGTPALATLEANFSNPWWTGHFHTLSLLQYTGPCNAAGTNNPSRTSGLYGREVSQWVGDAILSLHLNYSNTQKEALYVSVVQMGIDIYGAVRYCGATYEDLAGIQNGVKAPLVLAALALNDSGMKGWADGTLHKVFSEDKQTWTITQSDVGRTLYSADGRVREAYIQSDVGLAEYGEQHVRSPDRDGRNWSTLLYRDTVGTSYVGPCLGIRLLTGGKEAWNWPVWFAYVDRYMTQPMSVQPFHQNMWTTHRNTVVPAPPTSLPPTNAVIVISAL